MAGCRWWIGFFAAGLLAQAAGGVPDFRWAVWPWAGAPLISAWGRENGLPQSAVSSVLQSSTGYIWIGTYNGLVRFDGENLVTFDRSRWPDFKSGRVTALFEDSFGRLWVGDEMGCLFIVADDGQTATLMPRLWTTRAVTAIREGDDGELWLLLANGELVRRRDGKSWRVHAEDVSTPDVPRMTTDFDGGVWVLGGDQRLQFLENEELRPWEAPDGEIIRTTTFVGRAREGGVWIVANERIRRWREGQWVEDRGFHPAGASFVSAFFEMAGGTLAFGVMRQGLVLVSPDGETRLVNAAGGLASDWVTDITEDREGNLWVATGSGLNQLRIGRAEMVGNWGGAAVLGLDLDQDGGLWVGTEGGGLHHLHKDKLKIFNGVSGLTKPFVWAVETEPDGTVWAGTWGQGLFRGKDGRFAIAPGWDTSALTVTSMLRDKEGALWVGSNRGLARWQGGVWQWWHGEKGRRIQNIRCMAEDGEGGLWFGMAGDGLGRFTPSGLRFYGQAEGLTNDYVWALLPSVEGLWIGTAGGGLLRMEGEKFFSLGTHSEFPSQTICGLAKTVDGRIWMSSYGGVFSFPETVLLDALRSGGAMAGGVYVDKSDGLATLEASGGMQRPLLLDPAGALWVATARGLARVDTTPRERLPAPRAVVQSVIIDEVQEEWKRGDVLKVPPGFHRVEVKLAALRFASPQRVEFRYRLLGLSEEWMSTGRSVQFNYLPPGEYQLQLDARDRGGLWAGGGVRLNIVVEPLFWQRSSVRVAFGFLLMGGTAWAARASAQRRARLRLVQLERERAVERERTRIAQDLHDDLGASLTRLNLMTQASVHAAGAQGIELAEIRRVTVEITRAMDEVVWAASPRHDTLESLVAYLARFAQDMAKAAGLRCRLEFPLEVPELALTAEFRHNLFLAAKETLHNVVRHARAREVRLRLEFEPGQHQLRLSIFDDGTGFDASVLTENDQPRPGDPHGNGLPGLRRRLASLGGKLDIQSRPGSGTTVNFDVPLPLA